MLSILDTFFFLSCASLSFSPVRRKGDAEINQHHNLRRTEGKAQRSAKKKPITKIVWSKTYVKINNTEKSSEHYSRGWLLQELDFFYCRLSIKERTKSNKVKIQRQKESNEKSTRTSSKTLCLTVLMQTKNICDVSLVKLKTPTSIKCTYIRSQSLVGKRKRKRGRLREWEMWSWTRIDRTAKQCNYILNYCKYLATVLLSTINK